MSKPEAKLPVVLIDRADWHRVGNSVGFHCPECGRMLWVYIDLVRDHGIPHHRQHCDCGWSGKIRLAGFNRATG